MNPIATLGLALGAGFSSGLNLYATIATLGLLQRFGVIHLPEQLQVLAHPWVLGIALALYVIEFLADKIPLVDTVWDAIHTVIRPPAAALLAYGAAGAAPPEWRWGAALARRRSCADFARNESEHARGGECESGTIQQLGAESW